MNIQNKPPHEPPRRIQVAPGDNVAIVVNGLGLPAGTAFPDGLVLNHFVPQGHKVALTDIADGGHVIRYNEVIGTAKGAIQRGDWRAEGGHRGTGSFQHDAQQREGIFFVVKRQDT